jgi:hypothetical protein
MPRYTPELIASIHHDYVNEPDKSVAAIAADHHTSDRTIHRIVRRHGWVRRSALTHDIPQPMRLQRQARALLAQRAAPAAEPAGTERDAEAALAGREASARERIVRQVEKELAAEEAARAELGAAARPPADAERCARTLATLTQTLQALWRLRGNLSSDTGAETDDDDMPTDIDEFRRELARRIEAFLQTEPDEDGADAGGEPALVDAAR